MADHRFITLDGVHNLRDYGGYPTRDGRMVRRGLLYRSGQHVEASDVDLETIEALNIRTIVDLRGNGERVRNPCRRPKGWSGEAIFHDGETSNAPPHEEGAAKGVTAEYAEQRMHAIYSRMPHNPAMIDIFSRYFRALAEREGASLVHCFAGKDRTGIAAALLHHVLGVEAEHARADFLATNDAETAHILKRQSIPHLEERYGALDDDVVAALLKVRGSYFDRFFEEVASTHGSTDNYLATVLDVDDAMRRRLRERLVA